MCIFKLRLTCIELQLTLSCVRRLRVGWIEAPKWVVERLHQCGLQQSGGSVSQFASAVVASTIELGTLEENIAHLQQQFQQRKDAICDALAASLPAGCTFNVPQGGYFIWVGLPNELSAAAVMEHHHRVCVSGETVRAKVGSSLSPTGSYENHFRLCFARLSPLELREGATRLGQAIEEYTKSLV